MFIKIDTTLGYLLFLKDNSIKNGPREIKMFSDTLSDFVKLNHVEYSKYQLGQ